MSNNNFQNTIKAYLDKRAEEDSLFAVAYTKENKNIEECCAYIMSEVQKSSFDISKGVKCAPMSRDEVFSLAVHYYDEDDIKIAKSSNVKAVISISTPKKAEEKRRAEEKRLKALEDEERFKELKGKFIGIAFTDGEIEVITLDSVLDYLTEGDVMHHCVSGYALKESSIVLSARIDGMRIETVEVSLKTLEVVQSRGLQNKNTAYHDRIISLVNQNMHLIKERIKPKKKQRLKSHSSLKAAAA